ncbi:polyhydroxyalkanoate synthesis repressor PhaR [Paucibacter sp. KCTC 42545]|uniref:polyhydroxyalkanoate synthesis repressor PhaR n=1 Tax=Paucibacter sp. KCTC 42545 TaxID=1768242 RepID=UPI000733C50A|nr:polyhydroxyalkanoate synthesis repressor PhaR [Paucibacter sp. KCTC 42545]ALT77725.1 polyhydroxyalkanoate biosynthesis repressor PhaR [Paucibacter sp. KCTC 42545]
MATARKGKAANPVEGDAESAAAVRILKKYPNRRLYDTQTSSYITLADVKKMVLEGQSFEVRDAKTSEDLTRSILLQIILEEETGGVPMFSTSSLEQIIRFYGHAMQGVMGDYLERNVKTFGELQSRFAEQSQGLAFSPELWTQFMGAQSPVLQNLMGGYVEQSKSLLTQMQEQLKEQMQQAGAMFPVIPGMPGFPPKR